MTTPLTPTFHPGYDTAGAAINAALAEIGLQPPNTTLDPWQASNPAAQRMVALFRGAMDMLAGLHEWQNLQNVWSITTAVGDTGKYTLPTDIMAITDQSAWQTNYFWPLRGPYSAQQWQQLINYPTTGIYIGFRIQDNQLWIWPQPPPVGVTITLVYKSTNFIFDPVTNQGVPYATSGAQLVCFDWNLVRAFIKLRYLSSIGHDTTAASSEFKVLLDMKAAQSDGAAPVLQLARTSVFPYLTSYNTPDTGFGSR